MSKGDAKTLLVFCIHLFLSRQNDLMMIPDSPIIRSLSSEFHLDVEEHEGFIKALSEAINNLIEHDFARLVQILYRMDISESRLKELLVTNTGEDAGSIIAQLIIEREKQKIKSRKESRRDGNIPEDEKW